MQNCDLLETITNVWSLNRVTILIRNIYKNKNAILSILHNRPDLIGE